MEFGRVPESELNTISFQLPTNPLFNNSVLGDSRTAKPKVFIGCSKWGRSEWVGKIFPSRTSEKEFLYQYAKQFNCLELNATHYKIYSTRSIGHWAEKTNGRDFLFCPKMFQGVTHEGNLGDKYFITQEFLQGIAAFKDQLGPIFIQLSESFAPYRKNELFAFLQDLPKSFQFFVELRHSDWFLEGSLKQELLNFLKENNIGFVITDTSGRRDCAHMHLTTKKAFIRFVGNGLLSTDYKRIDDWVARIKIWVDQGIEQVFFFLHLLDEVYAPELSIYMIDQLNESCGLDIKKPVLIKKNLFNF